MAPLKAKSVARETKVMEFRGPSRSVGPSKFKVYSENDRVTRQGQDSTAPKTSRTSLLTRKATSSTNNNFSKDLTSGIGETVKASHGTHDKTKIGRKALADVSNVQGNSSRLEKINGSSAFKKSATSGVLTSTASSSRLKTGVKGSSSRVTVSYSSIKAGNNALRKSSNFHGGQTIGSVARQISRENSSVTRKSLPVIKRATQFGSSDLQGDARSAEKSTRKLGFPLKTKVGGKLVSQMSNPRTKAPKDRVSAGFIQRASRNQTLKDVTAQRLRKSIKPLVTTTLQASNARNNLNLKSMSASDKSLGTTSRSTRISASSVSKASEAIGSQEEVSEGRFPAEGNDNMKRLISDIPADKRSNRRKSYTSLLISRSKFPGDSRQVTDLENLPTIDDQGNPLEVAEYVDDIYQYYWIMEAESASSGNYMMTQTDITPQMRGVLINWLLEVHFKFDLMPETLYLTVALLDRYLSLVPVMKKEFQLVGLASLLLASKYEDFWHPRVKDLISISAESYTRKQVLEMEKDLLKKLKFRLNLPTPYVFMLRFLKASQTDKQLEHLAFYLIELSLVEYGALKFRPSLLCASAVYVARCTLKKLPAWTPLLAKHARYEEAQIRDCAQMILKVHKAASASLLKVTYDKYTRPEFGRAATIKPLNSL